MIIYNLYGGDSDYVLITINLINILIYVHSKMIFIHKTLNTYLIILHLFSLIQIICSILDSYFEYNFIIKYTITFFNIVFIIIFNYKSKKIIKKYTQNINQLNELTLNSIELNSMV